MGSKAATGGELEARDRAGDGAVEDRERHARSRRETARRGEEVERRGLVGGEGTVVGREVGDVRERGRKRRKGEERIMERRERKGERTRLEFAGTYLQGGRTRIQKKKRGRGWLQDAVGRNRKLPGDF